MSDLLALAQEEASHAADLNQGVAGGGGDYELPADGPALARFVGYIETGRHARSAGAGKPKVFKESIVLLFELVGPRHPPAETNDGVKLPHIIKVELSGGKNYGAVNEKSGAYTTFKKMNWEGKATTFSQLLGKPYILTGHHEAWRSDPAKKSYSIKDPNAQGQYFIAPPRSVDPVMGTTTEIQVPPQISPLRLFIWNSGPKNIGAFWDSIFIDGQWPERKDEKTGAVTRPAQSKNRWQEEIIRSKDFKGSPIHQHLEAKGVVLNLGAAAPTPPAEPQSPPSAPLDPLAGVN